MSWTPISQLLVPSLETKYLRRASTDSGDAVVAGVDPRPCGRGAVMVEHHAPQRRNRQQGARTCKPPCCTALVRRKQSW